MSVLIAGPSDTPYEDCLFAFDVQFPADYPAKPPKFHYISYLPKNTRLNPNLYAEGTVCVSLLGTWSGKVRVVLVVKLVLMFLIKLFDKVICTIF